MSSGSRLNQMQARFQQRQLEEKEQKLVRMYETAQAQALKRVGGTAASPSSVPQNPGKVRQMFEERRTKAGIDKSYPLQPIAGTTTNTRNRQQGMSVASRSLTTKNGFHKVDSSFRSSSVHSDGDNITRQEVTVEVRQKSNHNDLPTLTKTHRFETERIYRDHNLNDENIEDVSFTDGIHMEKLTLDSIPAKLPNVGGTLPSQRHAKLNEHNNNIVSKNGPRKSVENGGVKMNGDARRKASPTEKVKSTPPPRSLRTQTTVTQKPKPVVSQSSSPSIGSPSTPKARTPVDKPRTPLKTASTPSSVMASHAKGEGDGDACKICNRRFAPERLQKHQEICSRAANKKRKPYDALKHRVAGTEAETYVKVSRKGGKAQVKPAAAHVELRPNNWRKKHEDFINAIRAAKQMQVHISKGGKLSDLPPPPPSENPDYVTCPHCNRRFNQGAAERHIPKCANFQFNKPKSQGAKKR